MSTIRVRVLLEQQVHPSQPERHYIASGTECDLPTHWAKDLLNRGEAEPIAEKESGRSEKRPVVRRITETR